MPAIRQLLCAAALLPLAACATIPAEPVAAPAAPPLASTSPAAETPHDRLFRLFAETDEADLANNPISALFRGDMRYADRIGDFLTPQHVATERANAERALATLASIDRSALSPTDQLAYDTFKHDQREQLGDNAPEVLALTETRPMNHFFGFHTFYPTLASGRSAAPFKNWADYQNNLSRHADYARLIDRSIGKFREGLASGVLETRLTITNMIQQLDTQLAQPIEQSPYWGPTTMFPAEFTDAQKNEATAALRRSLETEVYPANRRLRDFLRDEYLPRARTSVGLAQMQGGAALYNRLIETNTTLPLTADYLHELGLSEVARIRGEMEAVQREVGFTGTLPQFFDFIRTDPQFKTASREALTERYYAVGRAVDAQIPRFFSETPRTGLEIRPYEPFRERFEAGGSYMSGTPDGSRPGIFYFNAYDLPSRTTPGITTLYLHEGAPGHHFQISLAQENEALPNFMRFGGNTAYVEGWALYAETLGYPMGLFADPYQRQGTLDDEMLRAMRLVVDTGIHAKGWSREQAIDYMLANSGMGRTDATAEVERYIAIPGQALAYKVGALTIQRLRKKAEDALGERFDIRAFHQQVLGTGALPLPVLEAKIDHWLMTSRAGG